MAGCGLNITSNRSLTAMSSMVRSLRKMPRYGTVPWAHDYKRNINDYKHFITPYIYANILIYTHKLPSLGEHSLMFLKEVSHLFDQKYNKILLLLQFKWAVFWLNIFKNVMNSWDCIFNIITPVFSVTWSFRSHSNMLIYIMLGTFLAAWYFFEPVILFVRILWWIKSLKEQRLFKIEIFCNNMLYRSKV